MDGTDGGQQVLVIDGGRIIGTPPDPFGLPHRKPRAGDGSEDATIDITERTPGPTALSDAEALESARALRACRADRRTWR